MAHDALELGTYLPRSAAGGHVLYLLPRDTFLAIHFSQGHYMTVSGGRWEQHGDRLELHGASWALFSDHGADRLSYGSVGQTVHVNEPGSEERLAPLPDSPARIVAAPYSYRGEHLVEMHGRVRGYPSEWIVDSWSRAMLLADYIQLKGLSERPERPR